MWERARPCAPVYYYVTFSFMKLKAPPTNTRRTRPIHLQQSYSRRVGHSVCSRALNESVAVFALLAVCPDLGTPSTASDYNYPSANYIGRQSKKSSALGGGGGTKENSNLNTIKLHRLLALCISKIISFGGASSASSAGRSCDCEPL